MDQTRPAGRTTSQTEAQFCWQDSIDKEDLTDTRFFKRNCQWKRPAVSGTRLSCLLPGPSESALAWKHRDLSSRKRKRCLARTTSPSRTTFERWGSDPLQLTQIAARLGVSSTIIIGLTPLLAQSQSPIVRLGNVDRTGTEEIKVDACS